MHGPGSAVALGSPSRRAGDPSAADGLRPAAGAHGGGSRSADSPSGDGRSTTRSQVWLSPSRSRTAAYRIRGRNSSCSSQSDMTAHTWSGVASTRPIRSTPIAVRLCRRQIPDHDLAGVEAREVGFRERRLRERRIAVGPLGIGGRQRIGPGDSRRSQGEQQREGQASEAGTHRPSVTASGARSLRSVFRRAGILAAMPPRCRVIPLLWLCALLTAAASAQAEGVRGALEISFTGTSTLHDFEGTARLRSPWRSRRARTGPGRRTWRSRWRG